MSEHHLTLYLHGIDADALISSLGARRTDGQGTAVLRTSGDVTRLEVWFPSPGLQRQLRDLAGRHPTWWEEGFSKGVDWARRVAFVMNEELYAEGSQDEWSYVTFAGETRSCATLAPTPGLVEWADRGLEALVERLGPARVILPARLGEELRPDRTTSYGHPLDLVLGPEIQVDLPGAVEEPTADDEADIPF
ncbi:MAG: hypothetical protein R3F61_25000 [Myxococcota bacterium]